MKQISSLDLYFLVKELKEKLENSRIETFYYQDEIFYIKIYSRIEGNIFLTNKVSKYIYLNKIKDEVSEPKNFIQYLRKYLKNSFIKTITQIENERIINFEIEKKDSETQEIITYNLIIELFANGNIILTDKEKIILNSLEKKKFKDRTIMVRDIYELPTKKKLNLFDLNTQILIDELKKSDLSIVKFIAINFGIGGKFAEEICSLSKIDKNKNSIELNEDEISTLISQLENLSKHNLSPKVILNEKDEPIDFIPFEFKSILNKTKNTQNFNEAIKIYYENCKEDKEDNKEKEYKVQLDKLINRLKKQENQKEEILCDYNKLNNLGNLIYDNYALIDTLLNQINLSSKEKGWEHIEKNIKENPKLKELIKNLNYKNNQITLTLK